MPLDDDAVHRSQDPQAVPATLLLVLFHDGSGQWRARVIDGQGGRHEFSSPFELARWSLRATQPPLRKGAGLR